jgi:hypothetical protein
MISCIGFQLRKSNAKFDFSGKVCLITGAGLGIGRAVARVFAASGCNLVLCDINKSALEETKALIDKETQARVILSVLDVRNYTALEAAAQSATNELGGLDFCIANAGIARCGNVAVFTEDEFDTIVGMIRLILLRCILLLLTSSPFRYQHEGRVSDSQGMLSRNDQIESWRVCQFLVALLHSSFMYSFALICSNQTHHHHVVSQRCDRRRHCLCVLRYKGSCGDDDSMLGTRSVSLWNFGELHWAWRY